MYNLVPRVLSYPPHGASSVGRVGENPGNEVASISIYRDQYDLFLEHYLSLK